MRSNMNKAPVLVVDRNAFQAKEICRMLQAKGHLGIPIPSFANALCALHGVVFDAVIVRLGYDDPYEIIFLEEAKSLQPLLKIIAIGDERYSTVNPKNINALLTVPLNQERLQATVHQALQPTQYANSTRLHVTRAFF
jgi:DNA-binding NtrC family response regulator